MLNGQTQIGGSLDLQIGQTLFIVRTGASTRRLVLPPSWMQAVVTTTPEMTAAIDRARGQRHRIILIVGEEHFMEVLQAIRVKFPQNIPLRFGVVAVVQDGIEFMRGRSGLPELLDIIVEKDLRKSADFVLLRAVWLLARREDWSQPKVGQKTLEQLNEIFIALSAERNPQRLLAAILLKAMDLTQAQGGVLYMVQESDGEMNFRLRISNDRSDEIHFQHSSTRVVENNICGYVALTGKLLNISDVKELKPLILPQYNRAVDYQSEDVISLLTIPLKNTRNEIIAVLQLVNKQATNVSESDPIFLPFEGEDESLLSSFATQAAICLENVDLYADIQRLFEGFVKASIAAIESRDPSTGGHSERVAKICVALARATTECEVGIYRSVKFKEEEIRELEYAALLHDFGKIGVREEVLVKAKKLHPYQLEAIKDRVKICQAAAKIVYLEKHLKGGASTENEAEYQRRLTEITHHWESILAANEPTILKEDGIERLQRIRSDLLLLPDGSQISVLSEEEFKALSVSQGTLTDNERLEIESHVRHTYQFLKMIPWTKDFRHLTEIAYCHHEKLDGTGYPRGLTSHEIPLQSKIMTIADIFDALTAADRWYKEAVPTEKALQILHREVAQGKLDPVLYELFVEKKIFELTQPKDVPQVA